MTEWMTPAAIWGERQNRPTLVARDLAEYVDADTVYRTLLRRGVFKWFAVRRDLIRLKDTWKARITASLARQREAEREAVWYERGYRRALEECRAGVRELCHSERWQAPDHDPEARRWLESVTLAPGGGRTGDA